MQTLRVEDVRAVASRLLLHEKLQLIQMLMQEVLQATTPAEVSDVGVVAVETNMMEGDEQPPPPTPASGLLELAGTWEGDDLEACLELVYATRQPVVG
ncbi:MAG: hypothetical protein HC893_15680 [Chloroflexaceae bacterium]|nr:hypothetical protein [Chloroflexaceae bacterium]